VVEHIIYAYSDKDNTIAAIQFLKKINLHVIIKNFQVYQTTLLISEEKDILLVTFYHFSDISLLN
jgi:hypothetical protein